MKRETQTGFSCLSFFAGRGPSMATSFSLFCRNTLPLFGAIVVVVVVLDILRSGSRTVATRQVQASRQVLNAVTCTDAFTPGNRRLCSSCSSQGSEHSSSLSTLRSSNPCPTATLALI